MPDSALAAVVEKLVAENDLQGLREVFRQSYVNAPVGAATQAAAISSIVYLGSAYDSLAEPADACLSTLAFPGHELLEQRRKVALERLRGGAPR